jgi:ribonuclease P protein component
MLAATNRLRRRDEFSATVAGGRRAARGAVVVHAAARRPNGVDDPAHTGLRLTDEYSSHSLINDVQSARTAESARAGFVVSKAVGGAVVRNHVRRRLRHLMRVRLEQLPDRTNVVVRALPAAATRTYAALGADLDGALAAIMREPMRAARPRPVRGRS